MRLFMLSLSLVYTYNSIPGAATKLDNIRILEATVLRALGDPDNGIAPGTPLRICPRTGPAPSAAWTRTLSRRKKSN